MKLGFFYKRSTKRTLLSLTERNGQVTDFFKDGVFAAADREIESAIQREINSRARWENCSSRPKHESKELREISV